MKIFITGASKGLGFYLAKELLFRKHTVWGTGRRPFRKEILNFSPDRFIYTQCDTTNHEQVKNTFDEMIKSNFIPDIAVFCAGAATEDIVNGNLDVENFKANFRVNLFGILNWIELFLPVFCKRKSGIFVGISSMSTICENHRRRIGYSASKLSLNKAFETLQLEYLNSGIKFSIFNMGRMRDKNGLIGINYIKAAAAISKIMESRNIPRKINMPFLQFMMTRLVSCIPEKTFCKYLYK